MKNVRLYLAIGVAAYLLILIANFPVIRLVAVVETAVPGLTLGGVEGSWLAGSATRLVFDGNDLGRVYWSLNPLRLLTGRLEYQVDIKHPDYHGSTRLGVTFAGKVYGEDLDAELDASRLITRFAEVPVQAGGDMRLHLGHFEPAAPLPAELTGQLLWSDATLDSPLELSLGSVVFDLARVDTGLQAQLSRGGTLGGSGTVLFAPAGNYRVDLRLQPDGTVDAGTLGLLETVSRRQPDGSFVIRTSGTLQSP